MTINCESQARVAVSFGVTSFALVADRYPYFRLDTRDKTKALSPGERVVSVASQVRGYFHVNIWRPTQTPARGGVQFPWRA
jgi:hypothetical protein